MDLIKEAANTASWRYDCVKEKSYFRNLHPRKWMALSAWVRSGRSMPATVTGVSLRSTDSGRSGQLCSASEKKSPRLLSPWGRNFNSDANDLNVLGQLTFWELQFAPLKNGTEIRWSWDHRGSRSWNGFESLTEFANAILKEYMIKWRVRFGVR